MPADMGKILVGLSGGVDSAVAALLLKRQGYDIAGAYIKTWSDEVDPFSDCPGAEDIGFARGVCESLDIPFKIVNLVDTYHDRIVRHLIEGYRAGTTPNPDVMCNREIKFGAFLDYAKSHGFDQVATGHYCRKIPSADGREYIAEGLDPNKDQSYFLAMVTPAQLPSVVFPIGHLLKPDVRKMAHEAGLPNAARKDSQGICFLGKVKINDFLAKYIPDEPGPIVNLSGKVLGEHRGVHRYTIGQRKGIGIPSNTDNKAYVVIAKDLESHTLTVAFDEPTTSSLYYPEVRVHGISHITQPFIGMDNLSVRVRYRDPRVPISSILAESDGSLRVIFESPQRALATGQIMAFYQDELLLGGGVMIAG